jgi:hypothetical protein
MLIQLHIPDSEVKRRLDELGYRTELNEVSEWQNVTHGRSELKPHVELQLVHDNGVKVSAKHFLEDLLNNALMDMLKSYNENIKIVSDENNN